MVGTMADILLRSMVPDDWSEVSALTYDSINEWYRAHGGSDIFRGPKDVCRLFCEVYEQLAPGCCLVAEDASNGRLAGSCFYHPRPTHISVGIMNVHPSYFEQGVGRRLLSEIVGLADQAGKPMRLASSTLNLDSICELHFGQSRGPWTRPSGIVLPTFMPETG
jgi:GNAT superfamily N-acetyltransferase